jgi:hypothetical protein
MVTWSNQDGPFRFVKLKSNAAVKLVVTWRGRRPRLMSIHSHPLSIGGPLDSREDELDLLGFCTVIVTPPELPWSYRTLPKITSHYRPFLLKT